MTLFKGGGRIEFLVLGLLGCFFQVSPWNLWRVKDRDQSLIVKVAIDRTSSFPSSETIFVIALVNSTELTL